MIKETTKLSDVIESNHFILPVLNRFGIRLGLGDAVIADVCIEKNIDTNFFLAIINAFNDEHYFPEKHLLTFSTNLIIDYLRSTHQYYLGYVIPNIDNCLSAMVEQCSDECKNIRTIQSYYRKYRNDLIAHINEEEEIVFPYVRALQNACDQNQEEFGLLNDFNMAGFEKEHHGADEKLIDLKNIMIKYLQPDYDLNRGNEFLFALFQFEKDLKDHSRIEENILTPKVLELEKHFRK